MVPTRIHYPYPHPFFSSATLLMDSHTTTTTSKPFQANCSSSNRITSMCSGWGSEESCCSAACARVGEVKRVTNETNVSVKFNLDGTGIADSTTGIPFLDHMLDQLS